MSRYFVNDPPIAIPEFEAGSIVEADGQPRRPNVIFIRARMDVETRSKVKSALFGLAEDGKTPELRAGNNELALLLHNVVRWEGPDLGSVPCTPANIRKLDTNEPHIAMVLEEIARRNEPRESPDPKSAGASGSMSAGAPDSTRSASDAPGQVESLSLQLATTIPRSPLRSALAGHQNKSENSTPTT
jgi:hypothetical protein